MSLLQVAAALALAVALASCGGGGGNDFVELEFSNKVEDYPCDDYYLAVDLGRSEAALAPRGHEIDCTIGPELADAGCDFYAYEYPNGDRLELRVVVIRCDFELSDVLFRCGFRRADVSRIHDNYYSGCCFDRQYCDTSIPLCVSDASGGATCEDCGNGLDDDGDGIADCQDFYCRRAPECLPPTTTTTSTTSTTSSTDSTSTTTTLPGYECSVKFRLNDSAILGSVEWRTLYAEDGSFGGVAAECTALVEGASVTFDDVSEGRYLDVALTHAEAIEGPADLVVCTYISPDHRPRDFEVIDVEASAPDLTPIVPPPDVSIIDVDCGPRS